MAPPELSDSYATIYIVDDDASIRETLTRYSESQGYRVLDYKSAEEFLDAYDASLLSCLLLDMDMPAMSGLELQQELLYRGHQPPIIFISGKSNISQSVQAIKSGAIDFIEKPFRHQDLFDKVATALAIEVENRKELEEEVALQGRFSQLTEREWEVLRTMLSGPKVLSSKEVARELGVSHRTVEHHRSNIMFKTDTPSMADLTKLASLAGFVEAET